MKCCYAFFLILFNFRLLSANEIKIIVLDSLTQQPLEFVQIRTNHHHVYYTDKEGLVKVPVDSTNDLTYYFSHLGYKSLQRKRIEDLDTILLQRSSQTIKTIDVSASGKSLETLILGDLKAKRHRFVLNNTSTIINAMRFEDKCEGCMVSKVIYNFKPTDCDSALIRTIIYSNDSISNLPDDVLYEKVSQISSFNRRTEIELEHSVRYPINGLHVGIWVEANYGSNDSCLIGLGAFRSNSKSKFSVLNKENNQWYQTKSEDFLYTRYKSYNLCIGIEVLQPKISR